MNHAIAPFRNPRYVFSYADDFLFGDTETGEIGDLGWALAGTGASMTLGDLYSDHPGTFKLNSGATIGTVGRINSRRFFFPNTLRQVRWIIRPDTGTSAMSVRVGHFDSGAAGEAGLGHYFSFLPTTSPNWRTVTRDSGGVTVTQTAIPYTLGSWYVLTIDFVRVNGVVTEVRFCINDVLVATHTTNVGADEFFGLTVETNEAVNKIVEVDHFSAIGHFFSR